MKFLATLLFTAAGVSAASSATSPDTPGSTCLADYILVDCLKSTTLNVRHSLVYPFKTASTDSKLSS